MKYKRNSFAFQNISKGFTLLELLVALSIMAIITGIVITGQGSFNKSIILSNSAYDIALSIRNAETYGVGSRVIAGIDNVGYGIHFTIGSPFVLFADNSPAASASNCHGLPVINGIPSTSSTPAPNVIPGDCIYTPTGTSADTTVMTYTLQNGITVKKLCVYNSSGSGSWSCSSSGGSLDIVFSRPNADTFLSYNGAYSPNYTQACLTLTDASNAAYRYVGIYSSGNITGNATDCPLP